jgi:polyferredoxin
MIRHELSKLKTTAAELRKFGLLVGGVFGIAALIFWWRGASSYWLFLLPAAPLILMGIFLPARLKRIYIGWMALGLALGLVVSTLLLTVFFYLVVTPLGLAARLLGKDFLDSRIQREKASYWKMRNTGKRKEPQRYEQQF